MIFTLFFATSSMSKIEHKQKFYSFRNHRLGIRRVVFQNVSSFVFLIENLQRVLRERRRGKVGEIEKEIARQ